MPYVFTAFLVLNTIKTGENIWRTLYENIILYDKVMYLHNSRAMSRIGYVHALIFFFENSCSESGITVVSNIFLVSEYFEINCSVCNSATGIFPFITLDDHLCQFHAQKELIDVKTIHITRMQIIFYNSLQEIFPLSLDNGEILLYSPNTP